MQCPFCFKETSPGAFCIECGRSLAQQPATPNTPPIPPVYQQPMQPAYYAEPAGRNTTKIVIAVLLVALITGGVGGGVGYYIKVQNQKAEEAAQAAADAAAYQAELDAIEAERNDYSWVPDGYEKFDVNYNMAYKKSSYENCWGTCYPFRVVSKYYCSYIYVEGEIEKSGSIVDYTNDSYSDLDVGYYAEMTLESDWSAPWTVNITEATCS